MAAKKNGQEQTQALTLTRDDMMKIFQCSATSLWRMERDSKIPKAIRSWGHPRWIRAQIEALFNA